MKEAVVILPNQLLHNHPALSKDRQVYLIEHPRYFSDFSFHKQKLILHRASMKEYQSDLEKKKYKVTYIEHKDAKKLFSILKKAKTETLLLMDPVDHEVEKLFKDNCKKNNIALELYESGLFLCDTEWIEKEYGKKKSFFMQPFYVKQRKRLNILINGKKPVGGQWSFDKDNRERLPDAVKVPKLTAARDSPYVTAARKYVEKHFSKNPGTSEKFIYPTNHETAKSWLHRFFKKQLKEFGTYQDAIDKEHPFLFHSLISPLLNIGLLTPEYVVDETLSYAKKHSIPLNSLEGFIRQIIGWREFVRLVYHLVGRKQAKGNFFKNRKKLPQSFWDASTDIPPIDDTIEKVLTYAYAHHIERLMVLGNFMLISQYNPKEVYRWFMELFIDSYDWVMVPNVYGMSQYADGGLMTTKPYIASSNYIRKMSNYKKGEWSEKWDELFWSFVKKQYPKLKTIPRMRFILNAYKKRRN